VDDNWKRTGRTRCTLFVGQPIPALVRAGRQNVLDGHFPGTVGRVVLAEWDKYRWVAALAVIPGDVEPGYLHSFIHDFVYPDDSHLVRPGMAPK